MKKKTKERAKARNLRGIKRAASVGSNTHSSMALFHMMT